MASNQEDVSMETNASNVESNHKMQENEPSFQKFLDGDGDENGKIVNPLFKNKLSNEIANFKAQYNLGSDSIVTLSNTGWYQVSEDRFLPEKLKNVTNQDDLFTFPKKRWVHMTKQVRLVIGVNVGPQRTIKRTRMIELFYSYDLVGMPFGIKVDSGAYLESLCTFHTVKDCVEYKVDKYQWAREVKHDDRCAPTIDFVIDENDHTHVLGYNVREYTNMSDVTVSRCRFE